MNPSSSITQASTGQVGAEVFLQRISTNLERLGYRGTLQRVDIGRKGSLHISLAVGGQRRWLAAGRALIRQNPGPDCSVTAISAAADRKIPLARQLSPSDSNPKLTVLSHLPARRLVVLDERGGNPTVLKGYRKGKGRRIADLYRLAATAARQGRFITPSPVTFNVLHEHLTMPLIEGQAFQIATERIEDFEELGAGISRIQALKPGRTAVADFSRASDFEVLDERARRMRLLGCRTPDGWQALRDRLEQTSRHIVLAPPVPTHRDLHDGQLLRTDTGLALLDFDLLSLAEPELDPANFLAHLSLRGLQMPERISERCIQQCGKTFLDGMGAYQREGFWARLRYYQASTFCRLQLVYSLRLRWLGIVDALGTLAKRCLDDIEHLTD